MSKKLLSVLLALSMVLALAPVSVWAVDTGTIDDPAFQTVVVRGDGPEDDTPMEEYSKAYAAAGLTLSQQATDGSYTLTIDKTELEKVVAAAVTPDENNSYYKTYKILENEKNPGQLWFGMEYKYEAPEGVTGSAAKALVSFDGGEFTEIPLENADGDGFYNYIKVYATDKSTGTGTIAPVAGETAVIQWLDDGGNVLNITKAVIEVEIKEAPAVLTIEQTDETGTFFDGDTVVTKPADLGNFKLYRLEKKITVGGFAKPIEGWEKFSSLPEEQNGYYLPLKITAGEPCEVTVCGRKETKITFTENYLSDTLIMRLDDLVDNTFTIGVGENDVYTIDCGGMEFRRELTFAIPDDTDELMGKNVSDLFTAPTTGEAITVVEETVSRKIPVTIRGTAKQVNNWTEFGNSAEEQSGYYLPLKLTSSPADCELTVTKNGVPYNFGKMDDANTLLTTWLNGLQDNGYKFEITVSKDGQETTYEVDCSGIIPGYTPPGQKYTVTFDSQDGSAVASVEVESGNKVTKPTDPRKEGHTFGGWYKEAACTNAWNFETDTVTGPTTLYAKWSPVEAATYTVTFNSQGGTSVASQTIASGGKVTKPADPTKKDYEFAGWYKEADCKTAWDFAKDTVTANTTLYAKWTEKGNKPDEDKTEYTVTFDSQGGSDVKEKEVKVKKDETVKKPEDPTRDGYKFEGWFLKDAEKAFDFTTKITADIILYAKWTEEKDPDPSEPKDEYMISVRSGIRHGTVEVSHRYAEPGEWVTITLYPDTDYQVDWVDVVRENGGWVYLSRSGRRYSFVMPKSDVVVDAGFDLQAVYTSYAYYQPVETTANRTPSTPVFTQIAWRPAAVMRDIPANSWAYTSAQWAYQNGYLDLSANGSFRLNDPVSHREMWKIMAQWLNAPAMDDRELTNWAMQNGAASGNLASGSMTRQNVVTYLYQCCFLMGGDMSAAGNLAQYSDARLITSASSQKAWTWAVSKGIISGTSDGYLNPNGMVSRGEFAAILMRLSQNVMK